jgi:putative transposase
MHTHLVFVTKYRKVVFTERVLKRLEEVFKEVCEKMNCELAEFNGEGDHVHLLINYPPTLSVSKLVNSLKGVSSRVIREENYPEIKSKLWKNMLWSPSYFAGSCGGAKLEVIKKYIENQERPV